MMNICYAPARDIKENIIYLYCLLTVVHLCDLQKVQKVHIYENTRDPPGTHTSHMVNIFDQLLQGVDYVAVGGLSTLELPLWVVCIQTLLQVVAKFKSIQSV